MTEPRVLDDLTPVRVDFVEAWRVPPEQAVTVTRVEDEQSEDEREQIDAGQSGAIRR